MKRPTEACHKVCYQSRAQAIVSIESICREHTPGSSKAKPVRAYYCDACAAWHITSSRSRMKVLRVTTVQLNTAPERSRGPGKLMIHDITHRMPIKL